VRWLVCDNLLTISFDQLKASSAATSYQLDCAPFTADNAFCLQW
jgi:hypothetical protein